MKCCLILLVVVGVAWVVEGKTCHSDADCDVNQCCLGLLFFGECRSLEPKGDRCSMATLGGDDLHHGYCPCVSGLTCTRVEETDGIFHQIAVNHTRCA